VKIYPNPQQSKHIMPKAKSTTSLKTWQLEVGATFQGKWWWRIRYEAHTKPHTHDGWTVRRWLGRGLPTEAAALKEGGAVLAFLKSR
jgi:hypothetical protein